MDNNSFENMMAGIADDVYADARDTLRDEFNAAMAKVIAKNTGDIKDKLISLGDAFDAESKSFGKSHEEQVVAREKAGQAEEYLNHALMTQGLNEAQLVSILDWQEDMKAARTKFSKARDLLKGPQ